MKRHVRSHARVPDMASWLWEALDRASRKPGAWTPRQVRARAVDVETLASAGYVRRLGGTPGTLDVPLYEITDAGRALLAARRGTP